jgi:hypothetical protein
MVLARGGRSRSPKLAGLERLELERLARRVQGTHLSPYSAPLRQDELGAESRFPTKSDARRQMLDLPTPTVALPFSARRRRYGGARVERSDPHPRPDNLFRLRHLAGVARDLAVARNPQASGAAYVLLFPEPLERFVPVHG